MKYLEQKPGHLWWADNRHAFLYFVREMSAVLILVWLLGTIILLLSFPASPPMNAALALTYVGFVGAIIHSVTWLAVLPKLLPFRLNEAQQAAVFAFLLAACIVIALLTNYVFFKELVLLT
jgi:fumarate reductase subunit C